MLTAVSSRFLLIGELARAAGVSPKTIRHYHRVGILPEPLRTTSGYRRYSVDSVALVVRARRLNELGVPLRRVRDVLSDEERQRDVLVAELHAALDRLRATRRELTDRERLLESLILLLEA